MEILKRGTIYQKTSQKFSCTNLWISDKQSLTNVPKINNQYIVEGQAPLPFKFLPFSPVFIQMQDTCQKKYPTAQNKPPKKLNYISHIETFQQPTSL